MNTQTQNGENHTAPAKDARTFVFSDERFEKVRDKRAFAAEVELTLTDTIATQEADDFGAQLHNFEKVRGVKVTIKKLPTAEEQCKGAFAEGRRAGRMEMKAKIGQVTPWVLGAVGYGALLIAATSRAGGMAAGGKIAVDALKSARFLTRARILFGG